MPPSVSVVALRLVRVLLLVGVNLLGVLLALAVAEGAARLAGVEARGTTRGDRGLWRYEALRGWGMTPGASGQDNRGGPDRGVVRVNAQGFRGADFSRSKLEAAGIAHLGLEAQLGDARRRRPELKWDFGDDTHWNVAAHELAARVMHLHLRKLAREGKVRLAR